ncbi:alpha/beta hydrolase [Phytomonospora sp. NPDC050363]|uniref:alpha/beta hydrolase n=1 Tax=Phytomonospora sp. NPDC050363 TaxID=3155642 RepID=UPI0033DCCA15
MPRPRVHGFTAAIAFTATFALTALTALTACSGGGPAADGATTPPPAAPVNAPGLTCVEDFPDAQAVRFGPGETIGGLSFGEGPRALVLLHQSNGDLCQWAPYAAELGEAGYRALAIDAPRVGSSRDAAKGNHLAVLEALTYLRAEGATAVTLVGASMGGTAVLAAAPQAAPPVDGVIALSAPTFYDGTDALEAVPALTAPVLYAAAEGDAQFGDNAVKFEAATPAATDKTLVLVDGSHHGVDFLEPDAGPEDVKVRKAVEDFLAAHMPL